MGNIITANRIKELRKKLGITQGELAEKLNVQRQIISYYETGSRTPNIDDIIILANAFNTSADYLLGLSDTSTTDIELKAICDYTGLSESSVMGIKYVFKTIDLDTKKEDETSRKMQLMGKHFVEMFLSTELLTLYGNSNVYISSLLHCLPIINKLIKKAEKNEYDEELRSLYDDFKKDMNLSLFNLQECCRNLFKEVFEEDMKRLKEAERTYESLLIKRGENNGNS